MNKKSKPDSLGIVCGCGGLGVLVLVGWGGGLGKFLGSAFVKLNNIQYSL